jgi:hypothetical protein
VNLLPHGRLAVIPDCGHLPHVEQPDRFAAVLSDWLTEHRDQPLSPPQATKIASPDLGERLTMVRPERRLG